MQVIISNPFVFESILFQVKNNPQLIYQVVLVLSWLKNKNLLQPSTILSRRNALLGYQREFNGSERRNAINLSGVTWLATGAQD